MDRSHDHKEYIEMMRKVPPEDRLKKSFELTELARKLFLAGIKNRFPDVLPNRYSCSRIELLLE